MKAIAILLLVGIFAGVTLLVIYGAWLLFTFVMPQIWPDGPAAIVSPGFWLFFAMWMLLCMIASMFRSA